MKQWGLLIISGVLALFGAVTLFMSGAVIFDLFVIREQEGNYIPFVVGANFVCGLLYLPAAFGFFKKKSWPVPLLTVSVVLLILAFAALVLHIKAGGIYEAKTIGALLFRVVLTLVLLVLGSRMLSGILGREITRRYPNH